jgi:signal transduction histidine kinase
MLTRCLEHLGLVDSFAFAKEKGLSEGDRSLLALLGTSGMIMAPIVIAGHPPGVLVIGVSSRSVSKVHSGKETLLLLTGYSGMRFRLEKTYQFHATELAATRVKAVAEIARTLAHEINNPIATLQNYLMVLGVKLKSRPDLVADLKIIEEEVDRVGQISEQLWDLSSKEEHLHLEPVDMNLLLSDIVTFFRLSLAQKQGVDLTLSQQGEIPVISSSGLKIRQILSNLIKNAIEAVDSKGMVEVSTELSGILEDSEGKVNISIKDNGPGISFSHIERAFLPGITTKKEGHAGLGLAIAEKLVKQIGGELHYARRKQGGMIFTLSLPL